jgi:hypothetical protein
MSPKEKAARGLELLEESVLDLLRTNPAGLGNRVIERTLGIASDRAGKQTGWLGWMILAGLQNKNQVVREGKGTATRYRIADR